MTTPAPTTLDQALIQVIHKTTGAVENGVAFLSAQLPDVIQQLLLWHALRSSLWFILFAGLLIYMFPMGRRFLRESREATGEMNENLQTATLCAHLASAALAVLVLWNLTWLKILIAPKLYLIEYTAALVKG